jgi:hypothetical protein
MEDLKQYKITGIVAYNNNPIGGATVDVNSNIVYTDGAGVFTIQGTYVDIFNLIVSKEGYSTFSTLPFDSNDNIKSNLGVIQLTPLTIDVEQNIIELSGLSEEDVKTITLSRTDFETLQQKKLTNLLNTLKFTLLPVIIRLISQFGVSIVKGKIDEKLQTPKCPTQPELDLIISKKNKLVRQLNISYKTIVATNTLIKLTTSYLTLLEVQSKTLLINPYPVPLSVSNTQDGLDKRIRKYKNILQSTSVILGITVTTLREIINYLNTLDSYIQKCSPNSNQEQISQELTILTTQQSTQESPVITNVNGFEMGVITEITDNPLKRRRAIARNKQGVIMLQGEWSFSSIDQILIDELVFYIQQNDLKAD